MNLTQRQNEILDFIRRRVQVDGMPPTRAEIVTAFGFASPNAAQCHLRALEAHGAIRLLAGTARGIVPVATSSGHNQAPGNVRMPIIGRVAAGSPLLAVENHEDEMTVDATSFHPHPDYMLRVQGDSMVRVGICDGDLLLVHKTSEARSGQIVVARIGDEITVKRLRRRGRGIFLEPENPRYKPIHVSPDEDFAIEGLGVGVIRRNLG